MDLGFANATAVIAGGTRGIGLATAVSLAEHGARVGVIGRDADTLSKTAATLIAAGSPDVLALRADLGLASDVDDVFATVGARWGESTCWSMPPDRWGPAASTSSTTPGGRWRSTRE